MKQLALRDPGSALQGAGVHEGADAAASSPGQRRPTPDLLALWTPEEQLHRLIADEHTHGPVESPLFRLPRRRRGRTT